MEKNPDWGIIALIIIGIMGVLIVFGSIRMWNGRKKQHSIKRDEL